MKLVRFDGGRLGVVRGEFVVDVTDVLQIQPEEFPPVGMNRLIADFPARRAILEAARGPQLPIGSLTLQTPVPWPNKLIAFPINFKAHGEEIVNASNAPDPGRRPRHDRDRADRAHGNTCDSRPRRRQQRVRWL